MSSATTYVLLGAGDIVPADVRIVDDADHLLHRRGVAHGRVGTLDQVSPRPPRSGRPVPMIRDGLAFFGTSVVSGTGRAVVTATGARTSYGEIRAPPRRTGARRTTASAAVRAFGG